MKRKLLLSLILCFSTSQIAFGQTFVPRNLWRPFVSIGYGSASLGDVANLYHEIVQSYQTAGIPVPTQTDFGRTLDLGGGVLYSPINILWLGVSLNYLASPAYSDYQDYAGTLKIDGAVTRFQLAFVLQYVLTRFGRVPLLLSASPGISFYSARITQDIRFSAYPQTDYNQKITSSSAFPSFELMLGTSVPVGPVISTIQAGYRLTVTGPIPYSTTTNPPDPQVDELHPSWGISDSGFLIKLSFATQL